VDEALRGDARAAAVERTTRSRLAEAEPIGAWIARQRVLRGISIDELERRTRIPRRSLERLESGVFDADRDAFARGFVRTVAFAIGLDADDAVARMLPEYALHPRSGWRVRARRMARRAFVVLIVAGVVGLAGFAVQRGVVAWPTSAVASHSVREIVQRRDALLELARQARLDALRPPAPLPAWLVAQEPFTRVDAWPEPAPPPLPPKPKPQRRVAAAPAVPEAFAGSPEASKAQREETAAEETSAPEAVTEGSGTGPDSPADPPARPAASD
jgi:transcriptional regulator with XRE-family HTH domain